MKTSPTQAFTFAAIRRHILGCIILALLGLVSAHQADAAVLASDATYTITQTSGAPYFDISGTGTVLTDSDDDDSYDVTLAAPFTFYGTVYTTMNVSTNGTLTFGGTFDDYELYPQPSHRLRRMRGKP